MRIGIYDPYLDTLGGGERYILSLSQSLSEKNDVYIFWDGESIRSQIPKKLSIDISKVKFHENIFANNFSFLKKNFTTFKFDVIIFVSDGSIPLLLSRKNFIIMQFPVAWVNPKSLSNKLKLKRVNSIICYSNFVKTFIDKTFGVESIVLNPSIDIIPIKAEKENIILTVGRFTKAINNKKQDFLIDSFKKMIDSGLKNWKFALAGSSLKGDEDLIVSLRNRAKGYPIEIFDNISYKDLVSLYSKSKIYWHAAGFGEDLSKFPEKAEHFGISTVEAMACSDVPVVIAAGGQKEIVEDSVNGILWSTQEELIKKTINLIGDPKLMKKLSENALKRSKDFGYKKFRSDVENIIIR